MFVLLVNASRPTIALSLLLQLALQLAGFNSVLVLAANLALVAALSHPAARLAFIVLCRRWLLDGQSRRRALARLGQAGGFLVDGFVVGCSVAAMLGAFRALLNGSQGSSLFAHAALLAGCFTLVLLVFALRGHWPLVSGYLPSLFLVAGALVGALVLCLAEPPAEAAARQAQTQQTASSGSLFGRQVLSDGWFCLSICWPLLLATAIIVFMPADMVEGLFPEGLGDMPASATAQQLRELQHFDIEERHFLLHALLTRPCAICLERFHVGESGTLLGRCKHVYHRECIMPWVSRRAATCPTCRAPL